MSDRISTLSIYRRMNREQRLCWLGLKGCDMHKRSGYYVPLWRDIRRWLY